MRMIECLQYTSAQMARRSKRRRDTSVDDFVAYDNERISWSAGLKQKLVSGYMAEFALQKEYDGRFYRPFTKSHLYFDRFMSERV